jgi:hypothetical protein
MEKMAEMDARVKLVIEDQQDLLVKRDVEVL